MPADHCAVMSSPGAAYHYRRHAAIPQAPTETDTHLEAQTSCSQRGLPPHTNMATHSQAVIQALSLLANRKCFSAFAFVLIVAALHVCAVPRLEGSGCQLPQVLLPWARARESEGILTLPCVNI